MEIRGVPDGATEAGLVAEFRGFAQGWAAALEAWPAVREVCQATGGR
jgi:hypothetical protein